MPLPEHQTPVSTGRRGQAPYNFVPLPEAVYSAGEAFREHQRLHSDRLHGRIGIHLVTETELYTRCAYPPREEDKEVRDSVPRQDFYHHGDPRYPVIPGASLRGMVRALVEVLSYSRISRRDDRSGRLLGIRDEAPIYRAVADQVTPSGKAYNQRFLGRRGARDFDYPSERVRGGYLDPKPGGGWQIRPARRIQGATFVRINFRDLERNGFPVRDARGRAIANRTVPVWVRPEPIGTHRHRNVTLRYARTGEMRRSAAAGLVPGTLVYSGEMRSRHMHTVIYEPDPGAAPIVIDETLWAQFREDRDRQRGIPCRKIGKPGDPLFYLLRPNGRDLELFGPTLFFRLPYPNRTGDYLPAECVDNDGPLDLAEAIFGTLNGEPRAERPETGPQRGRVAFDDAVWHPASPGESPFLEGADGYRWPSILSAPKPTSYQNYLVQTDLEGDKDRLLSYAAPTPDTASRSATALRGFKQYWHRGSAADANDLQIPRPAEHIKQYTRIRPVRPGMHFRGSIRFENLLPVELGALLAALDLPAGCRHRLGMGKPLGMGSVEIQVETTLVDARERYRSLRTTGQLAPAAAEQATAQAREAFRSVIVAHHNRHVPSAALPEAAPLWSIPRLASLRLMLDWNNKPARKDTAYLRDPGSSNLRDFRERRVLPTPAAVVGDVDPAYPRPRRHRPTHKSEPATPESIGSSPALQALQAILQDETRSQRKRLEAIDETLLRQLASLDQPQQRQARRMIAAAIGSNRKTRERLKTIDQRLGGAAS